MLDERACERRVYRLAALLTGRPEAALQVMEAVAAGRRSLRRFDGAHLDRLTVLRSREAAAGMIVSELVTAGAAEALASLPEQAREAWVLARVFATPLRETARAMDCSVTATRVHLARADGVMDGLGEDRAAGAASWRTFAASLEVPEFHRAAKRRRARRRRLVVAAAFIAIAVVLMAALMLLQSAGSG